MNDSGARRPVLLYDDNPDFGGHQIMTAHGVEALAADPGLAPCFMLNPANIRLRRRLEEIARSTGNLALAETPAATRKFQGARNHFERRAIADLARRLRDTRADLAVCVQGEIEDSSRGLLAARAAGITAVSYIPVPHRMRTMGAKLGRTRDLLNAYLFRVPHGFITISASMEAILRERGARCPIDVVPNAIDASRFRPGPRNRARDALGLPRDAIVAGIVGRIEFKQKQQDFAIRTMAARPDVFADMHLLIVGDGPDAHRLRALAAHSPVRDRIAIRPWTDDAAALYGALDILAIPSRFEGLPLVMLEALSCGVPVAATARDGMRDLLPEPWLFTPENADAFADAVRRVRQAAPDEIRRLQELVRREMDLPVFRTRFRDVVRHWLARAPGLTHAPPPPAPRQSA